MDDLTSRVRQDHLHWVYTRGKASTAIGRPDFQTCDNGIGGNDPGIVLLDAKPEKIAEDL